MPGLVEIRHQPAPASPPHEPAPIPPPPPTPLDAHLRHFHRRVLTDALLEATSAYWMRRASDFAHVGTPECDTISLACRNRADLTASIGLDAEVQHLLELSYAAGREQTAEHIAAQQARHLQQEASWA